MKINQDSGVDYTDQIRHFRQAWYLVSSKLRIVEGKIYSKKPSNYIRDALDSLKGIDRLRVRISNLKPGVKFPPKSELELSINAAQWNNEIDFGNSLHELAISLADLQHARNHLFTLYSNLSSETKRMMTDPDTVINRIIQ